MEKKGLSGAYIFLIVFALIVVGFILFFLFASNSSNNHSIAGNVVKAFQDCRDVQVPYEETETYIENVAYDEQVPLTYTTSKSTEYGCGELFNHRSCYTIRVNNIDTVGGTFQMSCTVQALNRELHDTDSGYVKPGDFKDFICQVDTDFGEDNKLTYDIIAPTKTETKHKDVQRTRTVTKYRTEQQCN